MGLGKTVEAIAFMNTVGVKRYLVVCPASLTDNWRREILKWSTLACPPHVFRTGTLDNPRDSILILSYGLCSNVEVLKRILAKYRFEGAILDECHYLKNPESQRTRNIMGIHGIFDRAKFIACLSGTPIVNKPVEIWSVANRLNPRALGTKNFREFANTYANEKLNPYTNQIEYVGSKNEHELGRRLRSSIMVRREKSAVLKDLPPKSRRAIYLDSKAQVENLVMAESNLYDDFLKTKKLDLDRANSAMRVRVQLACLKAPQVVEYCKMILQTEEKILVFGWHRQLLTQVICGLSSYGVRALTGATPQAKRGERVHEFQTMPEIRVFVGAIPAAGVGLTLTASSYVIMAESSWVPGENFQAEDRAHRIGQLNSVTIDYLVYPRSADEKVLKTIGEKNTQINLVLAGQPTSW
jgi:SWI/SNF-related matrix-associated actin-dependent regulator 1 of chromatin subfamily A